MRNSRWSTTAITKNGQIVTTRPNEPGDIAVLKWLARYPVQTIKDIAAGTGRSYPAIAGRVNKLKRKPNELIKVHRTQLEQPRVYQSTPQALTLARAGAAKLADLGFEVRTPKPSVHFIHQLTESQTAAAFEVGARAA